MLHCNHCGNEIPEGNTFCSHCGANVPQSSAHGAAGNQPAQGPAPIPPYGIPSYGQSAYASPVYGAPLAPRTKAKYTFLDGYLGIVLVGLLLILPRLIGVLSPHFASLANMENLASSFTYTGLIALAVALTSRAKGPDISVSAQMMLAGIITAKVVAASGSLAGGLLLAIVICAALGAVIGVVTMYLKAPAIFVSAAVYVVIWIASGPLANGLNPTILTASIKYFDIPVWAPYAILFVAFVGVLLLVMLTRLRKTVYSRDKSPAAIYIIPYVISGVLAALAGMLVLYRFQYAGSSIGYSGLLFPLFIAGYIACSRLFDNGFMPAILALTGTAAWIVLQNALNLLSVSIYIQQAIQAVLIAIFGAVALVIWFAQRKAAKTAQ